jgi:protein SCO1/2
VRHVPAVLAVVAAVAAGAGFALYRQTEPPALSAGTALPQPREIGDFSFVDAGGAPFTRERLEDRWTLLFTGFTHCPDVCPATLALMRALRQRVPRDDLQLLFVSVDPERDTPAVIAAYLAHFGAGLAGATGAPAEVERFTAGLGLAQVRNPGTDGDYTVDHSTAFVLLDPQARLAGYFSAPHALDALAADLSRLPRP